MSEELKISKEKVLEAAKSCSQVEKVMKILFPEAFKDNKKIKLSWLTIDSNCERIFTDEQLFRANLPYHAIEVRDDGNFSEIAFYLEEEFLKWELVRDEEGALCLLPSYR